MLFFSGSDTVMNAAMADARSHLPVFLENAASADLSLEQHLVKWAHPVEGENNFEHIWVTVATVTDSEVTGYLANQPVQFQGTIGDAVTFPLTDVSDWSYWGPDGLLYGSYTTRVMVPQLSASDQAYFESVLAPLPK